VHGHNQILTIQTNALLLANMFLHYNIMFLHVSIAAGGIVILFVILTFKCVPEYDPNRGRNTLKLNIVMLRTY
jgi:hypothetical protein